MKTTQKIKVYQELQTYICWKYMEIFREENMIRFFCVPHGYFPVQSLLYM